MINDTNLFHQTSTESVIKTLNKFNFKNNNCYISGPMTGIIELNKPLFDHAEDFINKINHTPINPHKLVTEEQQLTGDWELFMKIDLTEMFKADYLVMLPYWKNSTGATWEFLNAKILNIPVFNHKFELEIIEHENHFWDLLKIIGKKITHHQKTQINLFFN